jgi:hypothetical protein
MVCSGYDFCVKGITERLRVNGKQKIVLVIGEAIIAFLSKERTVCVLVTDAISEVVGGTANTAF